MTAERPRLVLLTADTVGGVWTNAVELAGALTVRGVHVALATMGAPLSDGQRRQVERIANLSLHESHFRLEWMHDPWADLERAGEWLLGLERELHPDVIHLNQFSFGALPFRAPTLLVAHSCVLSWWQAVHGERAPARWDRYRDAVRRGLQGATLVGAPTAAMLRSLDANYGVHLDGVVLPNGHAEHRFRPAAKEPFVISAGRLWDSAKNLGALDDVAPDLPWPVLVAGSTAHPDGGTLESTGGVTLLGELPPDVLADHFARASIFALPARYEPFGLAALEAGFAGCALVLGDVPSLREVWGSAATYVPPHDPSALRATLLALITDDARREALSHAARDRALSYSIEGMAAAYLGAYARLAGLRRNAPPRAETVPFMGSDPS